MQLLPVSQPAPAPVNWTPKLWIGLAAVIALAFTGYVAIGEDGRMALNSGELETALAALWARIAEGLDWLSGAIGFDSRLLISGLFTGGWFAGWGCRAVARRRRLEHLPIREAIELLLRSLQRGDEAWQLEAAAGGHGDQIRNELMMIEPKIGTDDIFDMMAMGKSGQQTNLNRRERLALGQAANHLIAQRKQEAQDAAVQELARLLNGEPKAEPRPVRVRNCA